MKTFVNLLWIISSGNIACSFTIAENSASTIVPVLRTENFMESDIYSETSTVVPMTDMDLTSTILATEDQQNEDIITEIANSDVDKIIPNFEKNYHHKNGTPTLTDLHIKNQKEIKVSVTTIKITEITIPVTMGTDQLAEKESTNKQNSNFNNCSQNLQEGRMPTTTVNTKSTMFIINDNSSHNSQGQDIISDTRSEPEILIPSHQTSSDTDSSLSSSNCSEDGFFPHPTDCRKFRRCVFNRSSGAFAEYVFHCAPGTDFWCQSQLTCSFAFQCPETCEAKSEIF